MRLLIGICALGAVLGTGGMLAQQPPAETKPSEQQPTEQQPPPKEDDPGKPVLRHGGPAKKHVDSGPAKTEENIPQPLRDLPRDDSQPAAADRKETAPASAPGAAGPAEAKEPVPVRRLPPAEALIEKAREAVYDFIDDLPNFICDQITKRYTSKTVQPVWKYKDLVEVELLFSNGKEDYQKVRHNGKRLKKGSPEDSGQWSTGEFGSVPVDVLESGTRGKFKLLGNSTASGMKAREYEYSVEKVNSHWTIRMGYAVKPSYSGRVWIEPESGRLLRIEMGTTSLPTDYPVDKVEETVDYDWVAIGNKKYLLPVKSENLACEFHSFDCAKNEIEFKNYRKFNVESQVLQVESDISFPDEEDPKAKKPAGKTEPPQITVKPEDVPPPNDPPKQ